MRCTNIRRFEFSRAWKKLNPSIFPLFSDLRHRRSRQNGPPWAPVTSSVSNPTNCRCCVLSFNCFPHLAEGNILSPKSSTTKRYESLLKAANKSTSAIGVHTTILPVLGTAPTSTFIQAYKFPPRWLRNSPSASAHSVSPLTTLTSHGARNPTGSEWPAISRLTKVFLLGMLI